jgi:hypothetical protein
MRRTAWMPTHSAVKWSTATKMADNHSAVQPAVAPVPHMVMGRSGMMVPSWAVGPWGRPTRVGASSPASRIRRNTWLLLVRIPAMRSRALILP